MSLKINSEEEIFNIIAQKLAEMFELDPSKIKPESHVYSDLGLDSIDAIDIIIKLQELTGERVNPEDFKNVRTVSDMVTAVKKLIKA